MILFQALEKAFYNVALFILFLVCLPRYLVGLLARDTSNATFAFYQAQKLTRAISLVSHNYGVCKCKSVEQTRCNLYIVDIAGTQKQFNRSAVLINCGMNFCIVTTLAFSYMSFKPFFEPKPWRCTLTNVESRLISSGICSLVSSANIFSKTPFCCKRQK